MSSCLRPSTSASGPADATAAGRRRCGPSPPRRSRGGMCAAAGAMLACAAGHGGRRRPGDGVRGIDCGFRRAGWSPGPVGRPGGRARAEVAHSDDGAWARSGSSDARPGAAGGQRGARRDVQPALRPGAPAAARRRARRHRAGSGCPGRSRALRVDADRARTRARRGRRCGPRPPRHPRHGGVDLPAARPAAGRRAGLLAHGRDRAAHRPAVVRDRASRTARSSPTTGTWSSTGSARWTAGSPSAAGARPTTSGHESVASSTRTQRFSPISGHADGPAPPAG